MFTLILIGLVPSSFISNFNVLGAMSVIQTIDVGDLPRSIVFNPNNDHIYVSNQDSNDVSVIDSASNTVKKTIAVGDGPADILFNPSNNNLYVMNQYSDDVSVIDSDTNTVIDTITVGDGPRDILFNPSNNYVYVVNGNSDNVSVIKGIQSQNDPSKNISDLIKNIMKNPLDIANSVNSANEIIAILSDNNGVNDQKVCNLLNQVPTKQILDVRNIVDC
ncbi:MAG: YncE family protein [Candidatus Nitrosocosmicus sp.]|nr:YncE family protein [Candidatus Nitrosocosmicus sp.]MDN5869065.1 YncE family protein [Candidatus Nitrosocosmicus sp.]